MRDRPAPTAARRRKAPPPTLPAAAVFAVAVDSAAPAGDVLRPLAALLVQLAERRRAATRKAAAQ